MSRIGEKIAQVRTKKGLTQKALGKKLGVSESFIKDVELGRKVINESIMEKVSKILGEEINDISMNFEDVTEVEDRVEVKPKFKTLEKIDNQWSDAFSSVLRSVPVYGYDLNKAIDKKQLPVVSNRINGYAPDKVIFLKVENDDMLSFRIAKDDLAFANLTGEIENNSICLVEYHGERCLRQVKRLDSDKILLISNKNALRADTISKRELKVIAKLNYVELQL